MAGMRDKLIHDYVGVNLQVVWKTVQVDLPRLSQYCRTTARGCFLHLSKCWLQTISSIKKTQLATRFTNNVFLIGSGLIPNIYNDKVTVGIMKTWGVEFSHL